MKLIIKNLKLKYLFLILVFTVIILALNQLEGLDEVTALRFVYGGNPLFKALSMTSFILFTLLLQNVNLDMMKYNIDNQAYLAVRYGSKAIVFQKLFKEILLCNFIFVLLMLVSGVISGIISGSDLTFTNTLQVIEITFRGYLLCLILSSIQLILLLKFQETTVFISMIVISFVLIFISRIEFILTRCFSILPSELSGFLLVINIVFCLGILMFCMFFARKVYIEKEII